MMRSFNWGRAKKQGALERDACSKRLTTGIDSCCFGLDSPKQLIDDAYGRLHKHTHVEVKRQLNPEYLSIFNRKNTYQDRQALQENPLFTSNNTSLTKAYPHRRISAVKNWVIRRERQLRGDAFSAMLEMIIYIKLETVYTPKKKKNKRG